MLGAIRRQVAQLAAYARALGGLAALLAVAVSAVVLLALQSYRLIDRELTEAALSRRASLSYLTAAVLSEKLDRLVDIGVSLATRVRFRQLIEKGKWEEAVRILRDVPGDFPFIDRITLSNLRGTITADVPEALEVRGRNFAHRDWYRGVTRARQPYVSEVYRRAAAPRMNVFAAATPIRSEKGEALGILVLQVRSDAFFDWTRGIETGAGGLVYVVDQKGMLASHPKFPSQGDPVDFSMVPVVQRLLRGAAGVDVEFNPIENQDRVVAYAPIAKHGWGVVLEQPAAEAFATRDDQLRRILIAYALILAFLASVVLLVGMIAIQRRQVKENRRVTSELERTVAERTAHLRAVADTANDAIISADEHGRIVYFNRGAERIFGCSAEEAEGKALTFLMPERFHEAHRAGLRRFLSTGQPRVVGKTIELTAIRRDGKEFPIELSLASWTTAQGTFFTAFLRDITERKEAEETLKRINEELRASNKELEGFSYSVSHDLRAPLRAINGFAEMVQEAYGEKLDDEGRRKLRVIRDSSLRMGQLIDDLLVFSRLGRQAISAADTDMAALARQVFEELRAASTGKPVRLTVKPMPSAWCDPALIRQVWINVIANAIKFSAPREQPLIETGGYADGAQDIYYVKDNGVGFDMRYHEKLFGVFERLHGAREFPGTGVGLAIVKRVVERHGGRVWAEGRVDAGATFFFALPAGGVPNGRTAS